MNELEIFHGLIIYKEGVTSFTRKAIEQSIEMYFELFHEEDLQYNIIKHRFQPIFQKIQTETADLIKKQFGNQFPILKKDDPVCKYYDYQKGDLIKIIRKSGNITYRIVKS
jgi:DNA-directed RNA polymerase I, II, and III subunit RPABC1